MIHFLSKTIVRMYGTTLNDSTGAFISKLCFLGHLETRERTKVKPALPPIEHD